MKFSIFLLIFTFLNIFLGSEVTKKNHLKENFPIPSDEIPKDVYIVGNAKDEVLNLLKKNEGGFDYIHFFENHIHHFKDVPYGAGASNSVGIDKTLVCTSVLNCVTLIEMFWAITYTKYQLSQLNIYLTDNQIFNLFLRNLNFIKYYDGLNCELHDRIHYFTDALHQLETKGLLENIAAYNGEPIHKKIYFISGNKKQWAAIKNWTKIKVIEESMSQRPRFYYPLHRIEDYKLFAKTGDIIALATDVPGLDVSHCGYITFRNDSLLFTHASSVKKKVIIEEDLCDYLSKRTSITGIYVYRPLFNKLNYY
jgi:hypothetical protein